jgi:hypothetical protein
MRAVDPSEVAAPPERYGRATGGAHRRCRDGTWQGHCPEEGPAPERPSSALAEAEEFLQGQRIIRARCESEWPGDYRMQEHCAKRQREGASRVSAWTKNPEVTGNIELQAVVVSCDNQWTDAHGRDWPMINHCIERQIEAYRRVR